MELRMRSWLALLILLSCSLPARAEVRAALDRYGITAADAVTLTLEATDLLEQKPDLTALERDFRVLSSRRIIISSHTSASRVVRTRWQLQLRPRRSGKLKIPPLRLGEQLSQALEIEVTGNLPPDHSRSGLFMDSLLSQDRVYHHAQLLYTARAFHREPLPPQARFQPPQLADAVVIALTEPRHYDTDREGERWQVMEQRFALFPASEGLHTLHGARLILEDGGDAETDGVVLAAAERFEVEVLPQAHHNQRGYWLPAERLSIEELTPLPDGLQPGESFTREIRLSAVGLPANALPALLIPEQLDGAFARLEDVSLAETKTPQGLVSSRTEKVVIEPLGEGELELPAIDLHWWNTLSDRGQILTLPARQLMVGAVTLPPGAAAPDPAPSRRGSALDPPSRLLVAGLGLVSIISSLGWLFSWHRLRRLRHGGDRSFSHGGGASQSEQRRRSQRQAERTSFQALADACQQNDAYGTQQWLIDWGRQFWVDQQVHSLTSLCEAAGSQALEFLILDLEHHLRHEPALWQGDLLLETLETLRRRRLRGDEHHPPQREELLLVS